MLRRGVAHWLWAGKKLLMALLHDWAFVTAIVLPATSARGTVFSGSQPIINHLGLITQEAASSPTDLTFVCLQTST